MSTAAIPAVASASPAPYTPDVAPPPATEAACRNCGEALTGTYCAACGQRRVTGRLTVAGVFEEVLQQLVVVDRGLWYTVVELTRHPGRMIRRYLDGERRRYVGPITYLSILTAIELFVLPLVFGSIDGGVGATEARRMSSGPHPLFTPAQAAAYLRINGLLSEQMLWMTLGMVVPFALVLKRTFRRTGINAAEAAVFAIYTYAHAEVLYLPLTPLVQLAGGGNGLRFGLSTAIFLGVAMRAATELFGGTPVRTSLRVLWAFVRSFALFSILMAAAIVVGVKLFVR